MDVIALHQAGFDNAIASLGTALTSGHANMIKRYGKDVYLSYDSDGAGTKAALRAIPILKEAGITCKVINMKPHKDPDEFIKALGAEEYQHRIDEAENSFLFTIRILERDYDMSDPESKSAFYYEVAKRILEFPEELELQQLYRSDSPAAIRLVLTICARWSIIWEPKAGSSVSVSRSGSSPVYKRKRPERTA